jgi:murein DD-endopeptidase MepM/ murein hydrolase activator NlpD
MPQVPCDPDQPHAATSGAPLPQQPATWIRLNGSMISKRPMAVELAQSVAQAAKQFFVEHRRGVTVTATVLMVGAGAAAFAVAPMVSSEPPVQQWVQEAVSTSDVPAQLDALAAHDLSLSRSEVTRAGDTADSLLKRLGVVDASTAAFLRKDPIAKRIIDGQAGRSVRVTLNAQQQATQIVARVPAVTVKGEDRKPTTQFDRISLLRAASGQWLSRKEAVDLGHQVRMASGTIRTSLFAASDAARLPDEIAIQLAEIFAADIDMHRELRRGDRFSVVYEALTADGEPITWSAGTGRILAAEFVNAGKTHEAVWFDTQDKGKGAYFDFSGNSMKRAFLASPLEFSRVSSGFAMRFHPLLQKWKAHLGVDYAAPSGTAVRTVGDGVVTFAGAQRGYGNVVEVQHRDERKTVYAHLSRIDVRKGQTLEQGSRVGAVGSTGWSTGPHLHFEFRVKGQHQDPLVIAKASETLTIPDQAKGAFTAMAQTAQTQLNVAESMAGARGRGE